MKSLTTQGRLSQLDILGQGELLAECDEQLARRADRHQIRVLETVPYGPEFVNLLREVHAL
jgi:hypothetical protein